MAKNPKALRKACRSGHAWAAEALARAAGARVLAYFELSEGGSKFRMQEADARYMATERKAQKLLGDEARILKTYQLGLRRTYAKGLLDGKPWAVAF